MGGRPGEPCLSASVNPAQARCNLCPCGKSLSLWEKHILLCRELACKIHALPERFGKLCEWMKAESGCSSLSSAEQVLSACVGHLTAALNPTEFNGT